VVCDGFVGNLVFEELRKSRQKPSGRLLKNEGQSPSDQDAGRVAGARRRVHDAQGKKMDPDVYGGAPFAGLERETSIKAHGSPAREAGHYETRCAVGHGKQSNRK